MSAIIDIKTKSVYIIVSVIGIIGGIIFSTANIMFYNSNVLNELISMFIPVVLLGILKIAGTKYDVLGGGDIEIFIFIALYLSILGTILTLALSFVLAGLVSVISIARKTKGRSIAFVPYIATATYLTVILGEKLFESYMRF